jgi:hypothetical protein
MGAKSALRFLSIDGVLWLLCNFHWNNVINGAEWVGGCGRGSDKSKTLMETEGKTQRGEELGAITAHATFLESSNRKCAYVQGEKTIIHYFYIGTFSLNSHLSI